MRTDKKKVQSNENPDLSCKRERKSIHMTPFVDSASTCLSIVSQERFSCFGKLNSLLTRNQPLSSVDEWMYTIFQTKSCSTFVEQHPPCITYKTCNIYTTGNELPSQSERSGLFGKYQNTCLQ